MNSTSRLLGAVLGGLMIYGTTALAQRAEGEAGLIGRRYLGAEYSYEHFSGSPIDKAHGLTGLVNVPLTPLFDLGVSYRYADTAGKNYDGLDTALTGSLVTHRVTEYGTGYFAASLGHGWQRADVPGVRRRENAAFWGVRAGYEIPVGERTAINASIGFSDAFEQAGPNQVLRYGVEANHWLSSLVAGVVSAGYLQNKAAPDAVVYTLGLRFVF